MIEKNWKELIKPAKLSVQHDEKELFKATIVAEPIERGFGVTIGNALRRILLSSLQGSSITSIQIQGVLHEFSSLPGVREDVTDMILNIKGIKVRMDVEGPKKLYMNLKGPLKVTAGDIEEVANIEIMNPDHEICTLDEGASLSIEFNVENGKGYVPAGANQMEDKPIGLIPIDAIFSPIVQVSYNVDNARVGIKNWWNRAFGKKDANVENGNVNVVPGTLPSNYKEEEAKYFQTGMYTPNVENSGINVIPGNMTGPTVITNNYYGGGGNGHGSYHCYGNHTAGGSYYGGTQPSSHNQRNYAHRHQSHCAWGAGGNGAREGNRGARGREGVVVVKEYYG